MPDMFASETPLSDREVEDPNLFKRTAEVATDTGGATINVSGLILEGDIVLGVTRRNDTAIGGPASHQIGEGATPDVDAWGTVLAVLADTPAVPQQTDPTDWVIAPFAFVAAADTDVRLTAVGGTGQFDSGQMSITAHILRVGLMKREPGTT